jgi:hypothetical protein
MYETQLLIIYIKKEYISCSLFGVAVVAAAAVELLPKRIYNSH